MTRAMIDAIHAAFDRRQPTAEEIMANIQRARAMRMGYGGLPAPKPDAIDTRNRKPLSSTSRRKPR